MRMEEGHQLTNTLNSISHGGDSLKLKSNMRRVLSFVGGFDVI